MLFSPPHIHHSRSSRVVSPLYEWAIVPEDRIPHTIWRLSQQKQGLTDNASLHLLQHCASQLCQGHVQLGFIHLLQNNCLRIKPGPENHADNKYGCRGDWREGKEKGGGGSGGVRTVLSQCYNILNCMATRRWNRESKKQYQDAYITRLIHAPDEIDFQL